MGKFCSQCGAAVKESAKFCAACGAPVKPVAQQQPSAPVQPQTHTPVIAGATAPPRTQAAAARPISTPPSRQQAATARPISASPAAGSAAAPPPPPIAAKRKSKAPLAVAGIAAVVVIAAAAFYFTGGFGLLMPGDSSGAGADAPGSSGGGIGGLLSGIGDSISSGISDLLGGGSGGASGPLTTGLAYDAETDAWLIPNDFIVSEKAFRLWIMQELPDEEDYDFLEEMTGSRYFGGDYHKPFETTVAQTSAALASAASAVQASASPAYASPADFENRLARYKSVPADVEYLSISPSEIGDPNSAFWQDMGINFNIDASTPPAEGSDEPDLSLPFGMNQSWPAAYLPSGTPVYPDGEMYCSLAPGSVTVTVQDTSAESIKKYVDALKGAGWELTFGTPEVGDGRKGDWVCRIYDMGDDELFLQFAYAG